MVEQDAIQMFLIHMTTSCRKCENIVILPCPFLYFLSRIPEITEENESSFNPIFPQGFHGFFYKTMTHTDKNKIIFRMIFRHMNHIGILFIFTFGNITAI